MGGGLGRPLGPRVRQPEASSSLHEGCQGEGAWHPQNKGQEVTDLRSARATGKDGQGANSLKCQSPFYLFLVAAHSKNLGKVCVCGMLFMACVYVCVCVRLRDCRRSGICAGSACEDGVGGQMLPCMVAVVSLE